MQWVRDALATIVHTCKNEYAVSNAMSAIGFHDSLNEIAFETLTEAVMLIIGEQSDEFRSSLAYTALTSGASDNVIVDLLMEEFRKNRMMDMACGQPAPQLMNREGTQELYRKYGGYQAEEVRPK